jgi:Uma2 family endonuclease
MATIAPVARPPEQRVVLSGVSWETYEQVLTDFLDRSRPHFAYDRGMLEIVSPTPPHEKDNVALAQLVSTVAEELEIDFLPVGSTTYRRKALRQGFEADSSFYILNILNERFVLDLAEIDPTTDPPPDLVIEVGVSRSSLDKLAIYVGFGVPEVWRCERDRVSILVLEGDAYRPVPASRVLPPLTDDVLTRFLLQSREQRRLEWIRGLRAWAREQRESGDGLT